VPAPRIGKAVRPKVEEPAIARGELEGEVISATEIAAASTADILGPNAELTKKVEKSSRGEKTEKTGPGPVEDWGPDRLTRKPEAEQPAERSDAVPAAASASTSAAGAPSAAPGLEPKFTDNSGAARRPSLKKKPIAVASTPLIGNYQMPPMDFLQYPDTTVKPTESKEELMANARLMQQTLAQFDIEVSLGDITKGPTITRYELHPDPGVYLE
jgi:S-DNA-T family DNA segregation ATPase FtsK/SpoIIIE